MLCFFILMFSIPALDQTIKYLIKTRIKDFGDIFFLWDTVKITYIENKGAAFGWFQNSRWIFIIAAILVIIYLLYLVSSKNIKDKSLIIAAGLIVGGGIGNLTDRLFLGYVIDYIKLAIISPICNLSDFCLVSGVCIFIFYLLFNPKAK